MSVWVMLIASVAALNEGQLTMGSIVGATPTTYVSEGACKVAAGDKEATLRLLVADDQKDKGPAEIMTMCLPAFVHQVRG